MYITTSAVKLLECTNLYRKTPVFKISILNSVVHFYTSTHWTFVKDKKYKNTSTVNKKMTINNKEFMIIEKSSKM